MKIKNRSLAQLAVALCLALVCAFTAKADLFTAASAADANSVAKVDSDLLKRRVVRVNFAELAQQRRIGAKLHLNLFEDLSLAGSVQKVEQRAVKNYTLTGHLDGEEFSSFAISVFDDVVAMNVRTADGKFYQVRFVQNGLYEVYQLDGAKIPECGVKAEQVIAAPLAAADAPPQAQGDAGDLVDVMVVYTPAARAAAGGSNAITAAINLAVSESNTAYQQSQINMRVRLVYAGEVAYTEAGFSTDLSRITTPGDGYMDEVQTLRNTYGADLVSLWINDTSSCGLAWVMTSLSTSFAPNGFSVVHWGPQCATGYYSFGHEMAHNMGCAHDLGGGGTGLYSYSHGWHFTGTNNVNYRTIMAYAPDTRIQRFSNPDVNYLGGTTGVPIGETNEAANAQTINQSAYTVANFRQTVISTNTVPDPTLGEALDNTGFTWTTYADNVWHGQTATTHDGVDAAVSGTIGDNQYSVLSTPIVGPGTLSFWWKVSSEFDPDLGIGYDWLDVFLDGTFLDTNGIAGEVDWTSRTFEIPAGAHTLEWQYSKDYSDFYPVGQDRGWVDQISYVADSSLTQSLVSKTNKQFRFVLNGRAGAAYRLQASSNLTQWATLTNILSSNTTHLYFETNTTNFPKQFYRAVSP